jgi:hypothetical protein
MSKEGLERGWISIHRMIQDNYLYPKNRKFTPFEAWIDILLNANHADKKMIIKGQVIECRRGESIRSMKEMAFKWNWSRSRTARYLGILQNNGSINIKTDTKTTHLTVCNYDKYQGERTSNVTTDGHQTGTNNKNNNFNKGLSQKTSITTLAPDAR